MHVDTHSVSTFDSQPGSAPRDAKQRGATLTGYAMTVALMVVMSLGSMKALEDNGETFLEETGRDIGTPRRSADDAAVNQLAYLSDAGNSLGAAAAAPPITTPPITTPPITTPPITTTSTTSPPITTPPTTTTPTTTAPTTTALGPSNPIAAADAQIDGLNALLADPDLDRKAVEKIEKAIDKLDDAIEEFADDKTHDGIKKIKEAIEELDEAEEDVHGLNLATEKSNLTNIGRSAASTDVEEARAGGSTHKYLAEADALLVEGDSLRDGGKYAKATKKYQEAAEKVKKLLR